MIVRKLIGVVPQDLALYDELTARENLSFWGQMYNLSGKTHKTRIDEVLEQIGLTEKANQRIKVAAQPPPPGRPGWCRTGTACAGGGPGRGHPWR